MSNYDWLALVVTLLFLYLYGLYKNRKDKDIDGYLLGNKSLPWYHVGFSLMATQASAVTFLSAPGQAFTEGMGFVQFYFGLPLAMILISVTFIPLFHRLKVYTAYEFLEGRFDSRTRIFTAILFLIQRGLSTGISIYAPSIILSTVFGWDILLTNTIMGGIIIAYSVIGGTKALSHTHLQQMLFVTLSLFFAGYLIISFLPADVSMVDSLKIAGKLNKTKIIDFKFNPNEKYNIWSGLIAGFFLQLSYFGTDQSQVGRYLTGKSVAQSRMGLLLNGLIKIPMQFGILLIGVLVFVYYLFNPAPLFFNTTEANKLPQTEVLNQLKEEHSKISEEKTYAVWQLHKAIKANDEGSTTIAQNKLLDLETSTKTIKEKVGKLIRKNNPSGDTRDVNYIFLRFILDHLPIGFIGILIAIIFSASMGSVASAFNSLAATTMVDVVKKSNLNISSKKKELLYTKLATVFWGIFCIFIANSANKLGASMIELVNILGSWFYGVILGIFLVAFYAKKIGPKAIFWGAVISEVLVIILSKSDLVSFLWLNPIGVALVFIISYILQFSSKKGHTS